MPDRVALLKAFYGALPTDRVKVESHAYGFDYLDWFRSKGATLEYGELSGHGLLHKYKISSVSTTYADELLQQHVAATCNVCLYFRPDANGLFCLNLDNNHKVDNTKVLPEMKTAVQALRSVLTDLGLEPLVIASGRGYHLWVRCEGGVPNPTLYFIMVRSAAIMLAHVQKAGGDSKQIKVNFYPDIRSHDIVSLRLFGSVHAQNRIFSHLLGEKGLLSPEESWARFEQHLYQKTASIQAIEKAHQTLVSAF